jgi:hypothetical protein
MKKIIVTTTINLPTKATLLFAKKKDWDLIIVGDLKTPHEAYEQLSKKYPNVTYLDPKTQESKYKKLSDTIGWNSIQRRNIGFIEAYKRGADIVATVDDDNIPKKDWGKNVFVGQTLNVTTYASKSKVFDPLSVTKKNDLWHRGYPIQLLTTRHEISKIGSVPRKVLIQADLWDGDPDIDAITRMMFRPLVTFDEIKKPYASSNIAPFNSQNTFLAREVIPYYAVLPHVGRMDDIWGSYIAQLYFPKSVIYCPASVYQDRNPQNLIKNMEDEIFGYKNTFSLLRDLKNFEKYLPEKTKQFFEIYRDEFKK